MVRNCSVDWDEKSIIGNQSCWGLFTLNERGKLIYVFRDYYVGDDIEKVFKRKSYDVNLKCAGELQWWCGIIKMRC